MGELTPAETLKAAVAKLREMAAPTTRGPWAVADCDLYPRWIMSESHEEAQANGDWAVDVAKTSADDDMGLEISDTDWAWMAFAHPGLAEPLAIWLESAASHASKVSNPVNQELIADVQALAVARVILGEA